MSNLEGLAYLESLLEWRGSMDFGLEKIRSVLAVLGNPQDKVRSAHIAGTNGKGSVSCALASILAASGFRVGLNVSPHLVTVNERIVVDGKAIDDESLAAFAVDVKRAASRAGVVLSLHEGITAISFHAFKELALDWAVMEVGLGGRLDSSNVLERPAVTAIVTIGYDHQHVLGASLEAIAAEKAGIIKSGCPMVTGAIDPGPLGVIEREAARLGAKMIRYGEDYWVSPQRVFETRDALSFDFSPALAGPHQIHNMAVAIRCGLELGVSVDSCRKGVAEVFWPGRFEKREIEGRSVYFDCAHNEPGVDALLGALAAAGVSCIDIGFGALNTKNWKPMIDMLRPVVRNWFLIEPRSHNSVPAREISDYLSCSGIRSVSYGDDYPSFVAEVVRGRKEPLVITGSMYMIGAVMEALGTKQLTYWKRG